MPFLLGRLTASGVSARFGLAAWLTALASVLIGVVAALEFLIGAAVTGLPWLADAVCRAVTGQVCAPSLYRSAAFELTLGAIAVAAAATAAVTACRDARWQCWIRNSSRPCSRTNEPTWPAATAWCSC